MKKVKNLLKLGALAVVSVGAWELGKHYHKVWIIEKARQRKLDILEEIERLKREADCFWDLSTKTKILDLARIGYRVVELGKSLEPGRHKINHYVTVELVNISGNKIIERAYEAAEKQGMNTDFLDIRN